MTTPLSTRQEVTQLLRRRPAQFMRRIMATMSNAGQLKEWRAVGA